MQSYYIIILILCNYHAAEGDFSYTNNPVNVTLSTDESATITLSITNDNIFELTETFSANLSFPNQETLPPGVVTLNQTTAEVTILDNDGQSSVLVYLIKPFSTFTQSLNHYYWHSWWMIVILYTELMFKLELTKNRVKESTERVQLSVVRSGNFDEIYNPSVEYRISGTGSSIALGIYLLY